MPGLGSVSVPSRSKRNTLAVKSFFSSEAHIQQSPRQWMKFGFGRAAPVQRFVGCRGEAKRNCHGFTVRALSFRNARRVHVAHSKSIKPNKSNGFGAPAS